MDSREIIAFAFSSAREAAISSAGNSVGRITSSSGGYANIEKTDGSTLKGVQFQGNQKWQVGQWVAIEQASGRYQIVGSAPASGSLS